MPERRAVVLAGGLGERLRKVVSDRPKPMAEVAGRPFLHWVLVFLAKQGVTRAIVSTGYMAETIEASLSGFSIPGLAVSCRAEAEPLGTAGGVKNAVQGEAPGDWLVCNGDSLALADLGPLYAAFQGHAGALLGVEMPDAARYGRLEVDAEGLLASFREKQPGSGLINAGMMLLSQKLLDQVPRNRRASLELELIPRWLNQGFEFGVARSAAPFLDIGTEESFAQAEAFIGGNRSAFA